MGKPENINEVERGGLERGMSAEEASRIVVGAKDLIGKETINDISEGKSLINSSVENMQVSSETLEEVRGEDAGGLESELSEIDDEARRITSETENEIALINGENPKESLELVEEVDKKELSEGQTILEQDSRYIEIRKKLNADFLERTGEKELSAAHQDFLFGNPAKPRELTLDKRAEAEFFKQYAAEAEQIKTEENKRAYKSAENDPAYKKMMADVLSKTNKGMPKNISLGDVSPRWEKDYRDNLVSAIRSFIQKYPEKAEAYASQDDQIAESLRNRQNINKPGQTDVSIKNSEAPLLNRDTAPLLVKEDNVEIEAPNDSGDATNIQVPESATDFSSKSKIDGETEETSAPITAVDGKSLENIESVDGEDGIKTSDKRFSLNKEDFARKRMAIIQKKVKEMKEGHPEVLSLCLFGSMVKGKARPESDIDGFLFVETEEADDFAQPTNLKNSEEERLAKSIEKNYQDELRSGLTGLLHLTEEQTQDLHVMPINKQLVDKGLTKILKAFESEKDYKKAHDEWKKNKPLDYVDEYYKQEPERPHLPLPEQRLSAMFHLDVGGGIKKYRDYLLKRLDEMGEDGEKAWQEIIRYTEMMEQDLSFGTGKKYPGTLKEALKIYGKPANK